MFHNILASMNDNIMYKRPERFQLLKKSTQNPINFEIDAHILSCIFSKSGYVFGILNYDCVTRLY
jgi:hypothetical protein